MARPGVERKAMARAGAEDRTTARAGVYKGSHACGVVSEAVWSADVWSGLGKGLSSPAGSPALQWSHSASPRPALGRRFMGQGITVKPAMGTTHTVTLDSRHTHTRAHTHTHKCRHISMHVWRADTNTGTIHTHIRSG